MSSLTPPANAPRAVGPPTVPVGLLAARAGSSEALGELLAMCRSYLLLVANSTLGDSLQAKIGASDLVQETFLEAQRAFDRFDGSSEEELLAWLNKILEHKLGNSIKRFRWTAKRDIAREVSFDPQDSNGPGLQLADDRETPGARLARAERQQRLERALERLSADHRQVIRLRIWEELPLEEVGRHMDRSAEAARKLLSRAIDQLQALMTADGDDSTAGTN